MNCLTLTLRQPLTARLDLRRVVPDQLLSLELTGIAALVILADGRVHRLEEFFDITDGSRDRLSLRGDLAMVDHIGGNMRDGMLLVEGTVGNGLAKNMRGGQIVVQGSAGDFTASGQRGGTVTVAGNVGDYCAGATNGSRRGMRGGLLQVHGSAGRFLGYRMRRGTVLISGPIGAGCASSFLAGTIVALSAAAIPIGVGMRRGTFLSLTSEPPQLHSGFTPLEPIRLSYLQLLIDSLRPSLPDCNWDDIAHRTTYRSLGDRASGGIGEILWIDRARGSETTSLATADARQSS